MSKRVLVFMMILGSVLAAGFMINSCSSAAKNPEITSGFGFGLRRLAGCWISSPDANRPGRSSDFFRSTALNTTSLLDGSTSAEGRRSVLPGKPRPAIATCRAGALTNSRSHVSPGAVPSLLCTAGASHPPGLVSAWAKRHRLPPSRSASPSGGLRLTRPSRRSGRDAVYPGACSAQGARLAALTPIAGAQARSPVSRGVSCGYPVKFLLIPCEVPVNIGLSGEVATSLLCVDFCTSLFMFPRYQSSNPRCKTAGAMTTAGVSLEIMEKQPKPGRLRPLAGRAVRYHGQKVPRGACRCGLARFV